MFDTLIFIVILIFMWQGYGKRFERELPRLVSLVGAVIFGIIFYEVIGLVLNLTPLPDWLGGLTSNNFLDKISGEEVDANAVNQIFGAITHEKHKTRIIGEFIVKFISFLILFISAYIILRKVFKKTRIFKKVKVVRQISPALGGVVGILKGIIYVYIALAMLVICEPLIPTNFIRNQIETSEIARFMYEDNYIANIVAHREYLSSED